MSSAERLARWTTARNTPPEVQARTPQTTPGMEHSLSLSLQERGSETDTDRSSLTKGAQRRKAPTDRYAAALTDAHRDAITGLVDDLRTAAPEACAAAAQSPWKWGEPHGLHPRFAHLLALDWRYLRRPRTESLERLAQALGLTAEDAQRIAAAHPLAIAPPPKESTR